MRKRLPKGLRAATRVGVRRGLYLLGWKKYEADGGLGAEGLDHQRPPGTWSIRERLLVSDNFLRVWRRSRVTSFHRIRVIPKSVDVGNNKSALFIKGGDYGHWVAPLGAFTVLQVWSVTSFLQSLAEIVRGYHQSSPALMVD
jgi:hypothetical protein